MYLSSKFQLVVEQMGFSSDGWFVPSEDRFSRTETHCIIRIVSEAHES